MGNGAERPSSSPEEPVRSGRTLRAAVVGCGRMGMKHVAALSATPGLALVAVCDLAADRLAGVTADLVSRRRRFQRHEEMYAQLALDLVVVATAPAGRLAPVIEALERGIAVLCEKPIAADLRGADHMVEAAARKRTILAVHHQYRMSPALRLCRSAIDAGMIGKVLAIRGRGKAGRPGGIELLEIGTHLADTMIALAGPPQWCSATLYEGDRLARASDVRPSRQVSPEEPDFGPVVGTRAFASYGFPGGVAGEMHFLGHDERMVDNYGVDVIGTSGQLALRCSRHVRDALWHLPRPMDGTPGQLGDWRRLDVAENANQGLVEAFYAELVAALRGEGPAPCLGTDGRRALEMVQAAYRSHREAGRRVELPLALREHPLATWRADAV